MRVLEPQLPILMGDDGAMEVDSDAGDEWGSDEEDGDALDATAANAVVGWPVPALRPAPVRPGGEAPAGGAIQLEGQMVAGGADGLLLRTCGHAAHLGCWQDYLSGLQRRYALNETFEGEGICRPELGEHLCPGCRRMANTLLPLAPLQPPPHAAPGASSLQFGFSVAWTAERLGEWAEATVTNLGEQERKAEVLPAPAEASAEPAPAEAAAPAAAAAGRRLCVHGRHDHGWPRRVVGGGGDAGGRAAEPRAL